MKTNKSIILLVTITGTLLICGCEKQDAGTTPETVLDFSASSEAPIDVDILSETIDSASTEIATAPISGQTSATPTPGQASAAPTPEQASAAEPSPQNATPEAQKTDNAAPPAQKSDHAASTVPQTETTASAAVNVTKAFQPNDGWTSDFSFQMPKDWSYTIDENTTDWGFLIQVNNREDASIRIYGQYGTINMEQFYTDAPTDFTTSGGLKGKFYQEKRTGGNGSSYMDGCIVFDLKSYAVSFYMPETVYNEYKDTLLAIFLSIKIEDIFTE